MFKQIKGIPMGGNASPLIADLFLANLEFKYMDKLVSSKSPENLRMAKKLSNNSRYIDDIGVCNMNNNNEFMICSKDIYPESIPFTTGCIENDKDTFLDLDITLEENRLITKIYNKVDDFNFEVVSFPFPTSYMSDHITYNSFYSQLVRFSSVCSKFNDFDIRSRNLLESLLNRGFSKYRLKNSFSKFVLTLKIRYRFTADCRKMHNLLTPVDRLDFVCKRKRKSISVMKNKREKENLKKILDIGNTVFIHLTTLVHSKLAQESFISSGRTPGLTELLCCVLLEGLPGFKG